MTRERVVTITQVVLAVLFVVCAAAGGFAISVAAGFFGIAVSVFALLVLVVFA